MSQLAVPATQAPTRPRRHAAFRALAVAVALVFLVGFGVWQSILTPWLTFPDPVDHGWSRTPELHRLADSVSAAVLGSVGVAALALAVRPRGRSGLSSWLLVMLAAMGLSSVGSSWVQGHGPGDAVVGLVVWSAVVVVPFAYLAPDRRALSRGGVPASGRPGPALRPVLVALAALGALLVVAATAWRLAGGVFEDPREDDVFGLVLLGLGLATGGALCARGGEGWRTLALILAGTTAYVVVAVVSLAVR